MDLLKNFTIKNLKLNKKRTLVTIIGIILSVALITSVGTMFMSARASLIDYEISSKGNYHVVFKNVDSQDINEISLNRKVDSTIIVQNLGYSKLDGIKNEYKPYVFVRAYSESAMENLGVNLTEGRLPENDNEIVLPSHLESNGGVEFEIGDTITLNIGEREYEESILNQNYSYIEHSDKNSKIEINYMQNKLYTKLEIKDYGKGISKEDLPHIFERFYKSKNSSSASAGIGLALAKSIVQKSNGYINVESEVNIGSKFTIKYMN